MLQKNKAVLVNASDYTAFQSDKTYIILPIATVGTIFICRSTYILRSCFITSWVTASLDHGISILEPLLLDREKFVSGKKYKCVITP